MCVKRKERETDEQIQTDRAKEEVDGCLPPPLAGVGAGLARCWCCTCCAVCVRKHGAVVSPPSAVHIPSLFTCRLR